MPANTIDRALQARLTRLTRVGHPGLKRHATSILRDLEQGRATSKGAANDGHYVRTPTASFELHEVGRHLVLTYHHQATRTVYTLGWFGRVKVQVR